MLYVEAPDLYPGGGFKSIFLAGGITGCPDWQQDVLDDLEGGLHMDIAIFNPRQNDFDINDSLASTNQVAWEHYHLRLADGIFFWFDAEQIQPIALYELGAWSMTKKPMVIQVHPDYPRLQDIYLQTNLVRPDLSVTQLQRPNLKGIVEKVRNLPHER